MKYKVTIGKLEESEKEFFERMNPGYKCTGETLTEQFPEGGGQTLVIFKTVSPTSNFTPYGMCRDCGDHYIVARYSRHDRIEKTSLLLIPDVADR